MESITLESSSPQENDKYEIFYKAYTEEMEEGEAEKYSSEKLTIGRGKYIYTTVKDFSNYLINISNAFQKFLTQPGLDP